MMKRNYDYLPSPVADLMRVEEMKALAVLCAWETDAFRDAFNKMQLCVESAMMVLGAPLYIEGDDGKHRLNHHQWNQYWYNVLPSAMTNYDQESGENDLRRPVQDIRILVSIYPRMTLSEDAFGFLKQLGGAQCIASESSADLQRTVVLPEFTLSTPNRGDYNEERFPELSFIHAVFRGRVELSCPVPAEEFERMKAAGELKEHITRVYSCSEGS